MVWLPGTVSSSIAMNCIAQAQLVCVNENWEKIVIVRGKIKSGRLEWENTDYKAGNYNWIDTVGIGYGANRKHWRPFDYEWPL